MNYYSRRQYHYRKRYYKTSSGRQQPKGRTIKTFDITSYIKNEFFNADEITFIRIANLYRQLYGYEAYKYMINTFVSWKSGFVGLSGQTLYRILVCVPKFLSDEKRFYILKCEVIYFIEELHLKQQRKYISLSQLNELFENYAKEIDNFNKINLSWFVDKGIFNETEIRQFLDVCKYALNKKLILSYQQVLNDLNLIKTKLSSFKQGSFDANYQIDFLFSKVNLLNINQTTLDFVQFNSHEIKLDGIFKQFAEKYILDELMKIEFTEKEGEVNRFVNSKDLDFFISQYYEILNKNNEASLKSEFKGGGGQLYLSLEIKSLKKIHISLFLSVAKLFLYAGLFISAIILFFVFQLYKIFEILFFGGLIGGGILLGAISTEFKTIKNLNLDLKRYGK